MPQFEFKASRQSSRWKLSKREFGQFRRKYEIDITYEDFLGQLNSMFVYYLNGFGLSVDSNGSVIEKESALYMWAQLYQTYNKEPLCAWMYQKGNGVFHNITFGTRMEFDKEIMKYNKITIDYANTKNLQISH